MKTKLRTHVLTFTILLSATLLLPRAVRAHCDSLDGPVVADARISLQKGDVTPVLKWVAKEGEKEIREAFALTMKVRAQGDDARRLADLRFFETLVRVHRAGEGLPYTGLKPAGTTDAAIVSADKALQQGSVDALAAEAAKSVQDEIRARFTEALEKKKHADDNIEAGRAFVRAYTEYVHFLEAAHSLASEASGPHSAHQETATRD